MPRSADYPVRPVPFTAVAVNDAFWAPRLETNRSVTVPYTLRRCNDTDRVANFERAAGRSSGPHVGTQFNDSDVFKVIEGASYALHTLPDAQLEAELDRLIELIKAAQEDDGYLYTSRTIASTPLREDREGLSRWSHLFMSHELYNLGHLYEAAAAHVQATGKRSLLDVALRSAALVHSVFGDGGRFDPPGHQEIEIGLVKLYRVTGDETHLALARRFLEARGRPEGRAPYGRYSQDHEPVTEQREAVGHAVRAGYMYTAMADVAALAGDAAYLDAIDRIWENVVGRKLYLTGGVGARHDGEAFGDDYELPERDGLRRDLRGHRQRPLEPPHVPAAPRREVPRRARALPVQRGAVGRFAGGDLFFYPNPLASDGRWAFNVGEGATRSPWFEVSCCPTNLVRALPALPGYLYAVDGDALYVNLYVGNRARLDVGDVGVTLIQTGDYPWDGNVRLVVEPDEPGEFALHLRVPGWSRGEPVPSDLYAYLEPGHGAVELRVNGAIADAAFERGFAVVRRTWTAGDVVELQLPMPIRRVVAHPSVEADAGRVAIERGPLVYCAEGADNDGKALDLVLSDDVALEPRRRPDLLGGVVTIAGGGLELVPYYAWSHRGVGEMAVWLGRP